MATRQLAGATHHMKDPSALTPYEKSIWDRYSQGMTIRQIAEEIGNQPRSVDIRLRIIKEKMAGWDDGSQKS